MPDEFIPLVMEEARFDPEDRRGLVWRKKPDPSVLSRFRVVIVGAGISGICMAIRLKQAGIDFTIVEKNPALGGTWYENTYPDCGVDTPSHFYCFSFAPNPDWSRHFSGQREVRAHLQRCAREHGIVDAIRFETEALSAAFDEASCTWIVTVRDAQGRTEDLRARVLAPAVGQLTLPTARAATWPRSRRSGSGTRAGRAWQPSSWCIPSRTTWTCGVPPMSSAARASV